MASLADIHAALETVFDPEIRKPITELGMVRGVEVVDDLVVVGLDLTTPACPLKDTLRADITAALAKIGVANVRVDLGVMSAEQREKLRASLRGTQPAIPFSQAGNRTRVFAVASGKGGVGKSTVAANLAVSLARRGLDVGLIDADVYGFSQPRMLRGDRTPTKVDDMILPPIAAGVKLISIGMFAPAGKPVVWRGPILHRAMQQFLADVFWGDLDVLLLDLPPGTGDIALSLAQLLPKSQLIVVTTPQIAAAEVAERAGLMAGLTSQRLVGVVENMSWLELPDGSRMEVFGSGGGQTVARKLSEANGYDVPLLAQIPLDLQVREASDAGLPVVAASPTSAGARAFEALAAQVARLGTDLAGMHLPLSVN